MATAHLDTFRTTHSVASAQFRKLVNSRLLLGLFLMRRLPMAFLTGLRVRELTETICAISVPFRWLNQNPFKSTYFAVLAMAAEMSSGMIAMMHTYQSQPSISMLVTHIEADFVRKATGLTTFTCADGGRILQMIEECVETGEGRTLQCTAQGHSDSGELIAEFRVTWSFKARVK